MVDLGIVESPWGSKRQVRVVWALESSDSKGYHFIVSRRYTASLNEKATWRQHLELWRGRKFTKEELKQFDLEKLVGVNCQVQVIHIVRDDGRTFANVQAVIAAMRVILFLAALGVVSAGGTLAPENPPASVFRLAAGDVGYRLFGLVMWAAAVTSVVGSAFTSVSFIRTLRAGWADRTNWLITVFITVSTLVFLAVGRPVACWFWSGRSMGSFCLSGSGPCWWHPGAQHSSTGPGTPPG